MWPLLESTRARTKNTRLPFSLTLDFEGLGIKIKSILLCIFAAVLAFIAARRSLVAGLLAVLGIGYAYGILRANLPETSSHFIMDAAVVGLYSAQLLHLLGAVRNPEFLHLKLWVGALVLWPILLFLIPFQDPLIQLVGLRGNIFLLPFLLIGARLGREELHPLALEVAVLNLLAFLMRKALLHEPDHQA